MKKLKLLIKNIRFLMSNDLSQKEEKPEPYETVVSLHTFETMMKRDRVRSERSY